VDDELLPSDDHVGDRIGFFVVLGLALVAAWWLADGWMPALGTIAATLAGVVGLGAVLRAVRGAHGNGIDVSDVGWGIAGAVLLALGALYAPLELAAALAGVVLVWLVDHIGEPVARLVDRIEQRLPEAARPRERRARLQVGAAELERRDLERRDAVDPHVPPL
jgi:hypothetical protein